MDALEDDTAQEIEVPPPFVYDFVGWHAPALTITQQFDLEQFATRLRGKKQNMGFFPIRPQELAVKPIKDQ